MTINLKKLLLLMLLIPGVSIAQNSPGELAKSGLLKIKKTTDFEVKGDGSSDHWSKTEWANLPQYTGKNVAYLTKVKMLYSDSGVYCLYNCTDTKITATLKRDFLDLYNEDVVEVFFWTDEKIPMYFEYELSPLNYELPLLVPDIKGNFLGWLPWHYVGNRRTKHATHIFRNGKNITGWTAEFFIPYTLLAPLANVPPVKGTSWRANFYRIDYDNGIATWQWQMVQDEDFHQFKNFGTILFD